MYHRKHDRPRLTSAEKQDNLCVYHRLRVANPGLFRDDVVKLVSAVTGVDRRTIEYIVKLSQRSDPYCRALATKGVPTSAIRCGLKT